jgi:ankyrin repeat protein
MKKIATHVIPYHQRFKHLYSALTEYQSSKKEEEKSRKLNALKSMIAEISTTTYADTGEPFLPRFIQHLLDPKQDYTANTKVLMTLRLLGLKFDLDYKFMGKRVSLLTYMSQFGELNPIRFLVEHAQLRIGEHEAIHPIAVARMAQQSTVAAYLVANCQIYSGYTALTMAVQYGYTHMLSGHFIAERAIDVNTCDQFGLTPLMRAAIHGKLTIITQLLNARADISVVSPDGNTFLKCLFKCEDSSFLDGFITAHPAFQEQMYGTDTMYQDNQGELPIHAAIAHKRNAWVISAVSQNPDLIHVTDKRGRALAHHVVMAGDLPLLIELYEKHGLSLAAQDTKHRNIVDYSVFYERIDSANWLIENQSMALSDPKNALLSAIFNQKKEVIDWFLSHPKTDLTGVHGHAHENLAFALMRTNQFKFITQYDLYRQESDLLFSVSTHGNTSVDEFFNQYDADDIDIDSEKLTFVRYVLTCLNAQESRPPIHTWSNFKSFIEFCLHASLIRIDDYLGEDAPLFHQWDYHFYQEYQRIVKDISEGNFTFNREEEWSKKGLEYYHANMRLFMDKPHANPNIKDSQGQHLFAKLIRLGPDGASRIRWLSANLSGMKITDLDSRQSSLLHLACEHQQWDIIRWCCEQKSMAILKPRVDGLCALDLALQSDNTVICNDLIRRLADTQWESYLEHAEHAENSDTWVKLVAHAFYGRPKKILEPSLPLSSPDVIHASFSNPLLSIDTIGTAAVIEPTSEALSIPTDISYEALLEALHAHNTSLIKVFKHERFQPAIASALAEHTVYTLVEASEYYYPTLYQLLRIPACKLLFEPYWKDMFQDVIRTNNARVLFLFLNHALAQDYVALFGLDLLSQAFTLKRYDMLMMLLDNEKVAQTAHTYNNELLRESCKLGLTDIALKLLALEPVKALADTHDNEALRCAADAGDLDTCEALLQIPQVESSVKSNDYACVREAIADDSHDLIMLMRKKPDIEAFISREYPERDVVEATHPVVAPCLEISTCHSLVFPIYFYNPAYYIPIINIYDFYDAILAGNGSRLEQLFYCANNVSPHVIYKLTSFALTQGQAYMVQLLFQLAMPVLGSNPHFCNHLLMQAIRTHQESMMHVLCQIAPIKDSIHVFDNRVLRTSIRHGYIDFALGLLSNPLVYNNLHAQNQHALRLAVAGGHTQMVEELLKHAQVHLCVGVFDFYPLRKAFQKKHDDIMLLLLHAPHVLTYAMKQDGRYDEVICRFSEQYLASLNTSLSSTQAVFLFALRRYPATRSQAENSSIVTQSLFGASASKKTDDEHVELKNCV